MIKKLKLAYYLSLGKLGTKSETVSSEMQARWERYSVKQLTDLLVDTAEEIHVRWSSIESFVFHQKMPENHLPLLSLLHDDELEKPNNSRLDTHSAHGPAIAFDSMLPSMVGVWGLDDDVSMPDSIGFWKVCVCMCV